MAADLSLNPALSARRRLVGRERHAVLVVDDFAQDPQALVADALSRAFAPRAGSAYPGVRADLPEAYVAAIEGLAPWLGEAFHIPFTRVRFIQAVYSIVTTPPAALRPEQRVPHVDTSDPRQIAILHYLCPPEHGGVGFYRHRPTGWESLDPDRERVFEAQMEAAYPDRPQRYMGPDDELFLQIGAFAAAFNRAVIFRSQLLHSGLIPDQAGLSAHPQEGRLTATVFLALE